MHCGPFGCHQVNHEADAVLDEFTTARPWQRCPRSSGSRAVRSSGYTRPPCSGAVERPGRGEASVAQGIEQGPSNPLVAGSNPAGGTTVGAGQG